MTTDIQIADLTASVRAHIDTMGKLRADDFDALLLAHKLVDRIPSVTDSARGSFTRTRDSFRKMVANELKRSGLALVAARRGEYVVKDAMVAGMARMSEVPEQQARMIRQRLKFTTKTWKNQLSAIAKLLPQDKADLWDEEVEYQTNRAAHDIQRALWFIIKGLPVDWPEALKEVLPKEPQSLRMTKRRKAKRMA